MTKVVRWLSLGLGLALAAGCQWPTSGTIKASSTSGSVSTATTSASSAWTNVVIGGGGYVTGVIFHPTASVAYARTDIGGVYRWNSTSSVWVPLTDGLSPAQSAYLGAESLALDPTDQTKVYMTTGQYIGDTTYSWNPGNGELYSSSNQGASWTVTTLPFPVGSNNGGRAMGERLVVDPNLPSTLFYASRTQGLWESSNSGSSWTQVAASTFSNLTSYTGSTIGLEFVVFDTSTTGSGTATQTLYVGVGADYATTKGLASTLYKSTNGGTTWTAVTVPQSGLYIPHMVRASDGVFYVLFNTNPGPGGAGPGYLYKFDGSTWTLLLSSTTYSTTAGFGGLGVYGSGSTTALAVGVTNTWYNGAPVVVRSTNDGTSWTEIGSAGTHSAGGSSYLTWGGSTPSFWGWIDDVKIDPTNENHVDYITGQGLWSTTAAFSSSTPAWTFTVSGLEETVALALAVPPASASYALVSGHGDIGGFVHPSLTTSPTSYTDASLGNATAVDLAWSNPAFIVQVGTQNSASAGVYSTNSGSSWNAFSAIPGSTSNYGNASRVAVTADGSTIIWAIQSTVPYYSTTDGAAWTATNLPTPASGLSYLLAADRLNTSYVYAYAYGTGTVYVSTDKGHTFTAASISAATNTNLNTASLAVNPFAAGDVWFTDGATKLYHSVNSGSTWSTVTVAGAYGVALGKPATSSSSSDALYLWGKIGSTTGVFRSDDQGSTWTRINDDSHQFGGVQRIAASTSTYGVVFLGTSGRGIEVNTP